MLMSLLLITLYHFGDQIREDEAEQACSTHERAKNCVQSLVEKVEIRSEFDRPTHRWE
jgi:hypothetical protein